MKTNHTTSQVVLYMKSEFRSDALGESEIELLMAILPELMQALEPADIEQ